MVPAGFPIVPNGWLAGPTVMGTAKWGAATSASQLKPGMSAAGFRLQSRGIPTIRDFSAEPSFDIGEYYPDVEELSSDEEVVKVQEQVNKDTKAINYTGRTIGPTAPPANFKPIEFLDYIVSLRKDAYYQGWIIQKNNEKDKDRDTDSDKDRKGKKDKKNKDDDQETSIMNSLDGKLNMARAELVKGNNKEAIEKLKSFTYEVAALSKEGKEIRQSHITWEAFALLYYNAQYLIDQLGGENTEREVKNEDKEKKQKR
jgi:hypothetical protein